MTLPINDLVTFEGYFKYYKRFYCLYLKTTAYYNVRTQLLTVGRHIFYCRVRPEGLLCDAERDLLAIAKFLVVIIIAFVYNCSLYEDVDTKPQLLLFSTKRSGLNSAVINGQRMAPWRQFRFPGSRTTCTRQVLSFQGLSQYTVSQKMEPLRLI